MPSVFLRPGKLNNRHDPIRLGAIEDRRSPVVDTLVSAVNVDRDNNGVCSRRGGRVRRVTGATHSAWSSPFDRSLGWLVRDSVLYRLNADYTLTALATLTNNAPMAYEPVNSEIVASNGSDIGWLRSGNFTPFAPTLGDFEATMPAGQYLAFLNGVLFSAIGSVLYASKPYNVERRDVRVGIFPFPGYIRMLAAVEDGLWAATDKQVVFVSGTGADGLRYQERTTAAPPDGAFSVGYEESAQGVRRVVRWVSTEGFCRGFAGGAFETLSDPDVAMPTGSAGKCFHRVVNGIDQYVAVIRNPVGSDAFVPRSLTVNTITVS